MTPWDAETQESVEIVANLLKMNPENLCNFILIGIDHSDSHTPVTLSTVPADAIAGYVTALGISMQSSILSVE